MWRKINLPDPTYYFPCVLNPRQPLPPLARRGVCTEPLIHSDLQPSFRSSATLPASPAYNEPPPCFLPPGLQECIASEPCLPSSHPALAWLPLQPPGHQRWVSMPSVSGPFTLSSRLMIKNDGVEQGWVPNLLGICCLVMSPHWQQHFEICQLSSSQSVSHILWFILFRAIF